MSVPNLHLGLHVTLALYVVIFERQEYHSNTNLENQNSNTNRYSSGRCTGCVVDCGDGTTSVVPIFRAVVQCRSRHVSVLSGSVLTDYMIEMFRKRSVMRSDSDAYENEDEVETKEERENIFEEKWRHMIRPLGEHMKRFHTNCTYLSSCCFCCLVTH